MYAIILNSEGSTNEWGYSYIIEFAKSLSKTKEIVIEEHENIEIYKMPRNWGKEQESIIRKDMTRKGGVIYTNNDDVIIDEIKDIGTKV